MAMFTNTQSHNLVMLNKCKFSDDVNNYQNHGDIGMETTDKDATWNTAMIVPSAKLRVNLLALNVGRKA